MENAPIFSCPDRLIVLTLSSSNPIVRACNKDSDAARCKGKMGTHPPALHTEVYVSQSPAHTRPSSTTVPILQQRETD